MKTTLSMVVLGISLLGTSFPAFAHHSAQAEYDRSKPLTLVGTVTKVEIMNPHGWLHIDAKDSQGKVVNWALELPGPALFRRNGLDPNIFDTLKTSGETVTVTAYPARDGSKHALGGSLTRADGQTVISLGKFGSDGGYGGGYNGGQAPQAQ